MNSILRKAAKLSRHSCARFDLALMTSGELGSGRKSGEVDGLSFGMSFCRLLAVFRVRAGCGTSKFRGF